MPAGRPLIELDSKLITRRYLGGESEGFLAQEFGVGRSTIHRRLGAEGVALRSPTEASNLLRFKTFELTEDLIQLFDGLLLGDASIEQHANSMGRLELTQRRPCVGWLREIATVLELAGVRTSIADRGARGFQLRTRKYATLTDQRSRWYPGGTKTVPEDVRITPLSVSHWFWGDGSIGNNGYRIEFCTDGFSQEEVEGLGARLSDLIHAPVKARLRTRSLPYFRIYVERAAGRHRLAKMLRPHCPVCFQYKLEVKNGNGHCGDSRS